MLGGNTYLIIWPLVVFYYAYGPGSLFKLSRIVAHRVPWTTKHPFLDVEHSIRCILVSLLQLGFCIVLIAISGASLSQLGFRTFRPGLLVFGMVLGLGEMGLSSFLCFVAMRAIRALAPANVPQKDDDWLALLQAGWVRQIKKMFQIAPPMVAGSTIILYIAVEEIIFRSVLISAALSLGPVASVATSTVFFALIQTFHMPSWRSGLFPVIGALVVGPIHGTLFFQTQEIWPLIGAHVTMFLAGAL